MYSHYNLHSTSRLLCLDDATGELRWSATVSGRANGMPRVNGDKTMVAMVHNDDVDDRGGVGVFNLIDGSILWEHEGSPYAPFGPPSSIDWNDVIYWGDSSLRGYSDSGSIYHLDFKSPEKVHIDFLFDSSTMTPPTIRADGEQLWLGGRDASIYSWNLVGSRRGRLWQKHVALSQRNVSFRKCFFSFFILCETAKWLTCSFQLL